MQYKNKKQIYTISAGARILKSRNHPSPLTQISKQNADSLELHTDIGDFVLNFRPNSRVYVQTAPNPPYTTSPIIFYEPSKGYLIPFLNILQRRMMQKTEHTILSRRIDEVSYLDNLLKDLLEKKALAFISLQNDPHNSSLDIIRIGHDEHNYDVELGYLAGSLRGRILVPTLKQKVDKETYLEYCVSGLGLDIPSSKRRPKTIIHGVIAQNYGTIPDLGIENRI